jgi:hypothetical protein
MTRCPKCGSNDPKYAGVRCMDRLGEPIVTHDPWHDAERQCPECGSPDKTRRLHQLNYLPPARCINPWHDTRAGEGKEAAMPTRCYVMVGKTACRLTENDLIHHKDRARAQGFSEDEFPDSEFHDYVPSDAAPAVPEPSEHHDCYKGCWDDCPSCNPERKPEEPAETPQTATPAPLKRKNEHQEECVCVDCMPQNAPPREHSHETNAAESKPDCESQLPPSQGGGLDHNNGSTKRRIVLQLDSIETPQTAEQFYARNLAPGLMCDVSGDLAEDIRVMSYSKAMRFAEAYAESRLQELQRECERLRIALKAIDRSADIESIAEIEAARNSELAELHLQLIGRDCDICGAELPAEKWRQCAQCADKDEAERDRLQRQLAESQKEFSDLSAYCLRDGNQSSEAHAIYWRDRAEVLHRQLDRLRQALTTAMPYIEFYAQREMTSPSNNQEAVIETRAMLSKARAALSAPTTSGKPPQF